MEFPVPVENDLKRICMTCGKDMGMKPAAETGVTHGMCPECLREHIEKREKEKRMALAANEDLPKSMEQKAADGRALYGSVKNADRPPTEQELRELHAKEHSGKFNECPKCEKLIGG